MSEHTDGGRPGGLGGGQLEPTGRHRVDVDGIDESPVPDPGLPAHEPRLTDVDPAAERRAERQVAAMFAIAAVLAIAFCVFYVVVGVHSTVFGYSASNLALGLTLGVALLLIGAGAIQWAKRLMGDDEMVEQRHPTASSPLDRAEAIAAFRAGTAESGFGRRTLIRTSLIGALGMLGLPAVFLLGDLGPLPHDKFGFTVWRKGMRVVNDVDGAPLRPSDIQIGQLVNAEPSVFFPSTGPNGRTVPSPFAGAALQDAKAKAAVILVRMQPDEIHPYPQRRNWGVDGILCYSKICTHVGCAISLWEQQTHHLLCPCHQSTFDLANNGVVIFGPAARSLPQLPIRVDSQGYLVAVSDFHVPVGPSYWERG
jgi:ubiquinol-cytochrome c reductase iron-sulfur subunit